MSFGHELVGLVRVTSFGESGIAEETIEIAVPHPDGFAVFTFRGAVLAWNVNQNPRVLAEEANEKRSDSGALHRFEGSATLLYSGPDYDDIRAKAREAYAPFIVIQKMSAKIWSVVRRRRPDFRDCAVVVNLIR